MNTSLKESIKATYKIQCEKYKPQKVIREGLLGLHSLFDTTVSFLGSCVNQINKELLNKWECPTERDRDADEKEIKISLDIYPDGGTKVRGKRRRRAKRRIKDGVQ